MWTCLFIISKQHEPPALQTFVIVSKFSPSKQYIMVNLHPKYGFH